MKRFSFIRLNTAARRARAATLMSILIIWGVIYSFTYTWTSSRLLHSLAQENKQAVEVVQAMVEQTARSYLHARAQAARDILQSYTDRSDKGLLNREDARREALNTLKDQSLQENGYIFCVNENGRLAGAPTIEELAPPVSNLALKLNETEEGLLEFGWNTRSGNKRHQLLIYTIPHTAWKLHVCAALPVDRLHLLTPRQELNERLKKLATDEQQFPFVLDFNGETVAPGLWSSGELPDSDYYGKPFVRGILDKGLGNIDFTMAGIKSDIPVHMGAVISDIPSLDWYVVTTYNNQKAFAPLRRLNPIAAVTLVCALLAGWLTQAGTARSLRRKLFHTARKTRREFRERLIRLTEELAVSRKSEENLQERLDHVSKWRYELERKSSEIELLRRLGDDLQACRNGDETYRTFEKHARNLFPDDKGTLLIFNAERDQLESVAFWGDNLACEKEFVLDDCWGMRRGEPYHVQDPVDDLICPHIPSPAPVQGYLCLPMTAQGDNQGMLHLQFGQPEFIEDEEKRNEMIKAKAQLAQTVAKQFSLALANLNLREALHRQSIRDQLTGLFNRRHMEESLKREIHRAQRNEQSLGIIMLDVDHFKSFNDTYGHDEGDNLLRSMGSMLSKHTRLGDIACRYGGEEFLIIMPDASLEATTQRAKMLCQLAPQILRIKSIKTSDRRITISLGVAVYPDHGQSGEELTLAADSALYRAKHAGRNRVVVWQPEARQSELDLETH